MSDEIKGLAVLHDTIPEHVLFVVCVPDGPRWGGTDPFISRIPVHPKGTPKQCNPQWEYRIDGNLLHVTPSLQVSVRAPSDDEKTEVVHELFHNGGSWSVPFVRWSEVQGEAGPEGRWTTCRRMNSALLERG